MESTALAEKVNGPLATPVGEVSITTILDRAVASNMPPDALAKIVDLYERIADRQAAQEFAVAMARFQAECTPIAKTSDAKITTRAGGSYGYKYAELDEIARTVRPLLAKHGLSYTWDSTEDKGLVTCTCIVRHINGHMVRANFVAPVDSAASMSGAQKNASALTYARRQSLIQALGLTTCDPDTDAPRAALDKITDNQAANIDHVIAELNVDRTKFLRAMGIEKIAGLPAADFRRAMDLLDKKRQQQGGKA